MKQSALLIILSLLLLASCTVNPATGARQLTLISEKQEIAMGLKNDAAVQASMGFYPDEDLQEYVAVLGKKLAATSERPDLPWTFRVVDDPTVNAFALPGGFIYLTRGILGHFNSEAELVSVLGHEIGHVTARHSVEQISRSQLASIGMGVAVIANPKLAGWSDLAGAGLGLMFLKFGRDDERESDDLGFRYMTRSGYDPNQMPGVFRTLDRVSAGSGTARIPEWAATHPNPENRAERIEAKIAELPANSRTGMIEADSYLRRLDGLVFGVDPRQGYFIENRFYHPDLQVQMTFPGEWKTQNQTRAVVGISGKEDAIILLTLADGSNSEDAARKFFAKYELKRGRSFSQDYHLFSTSETEQQLVGAVGFVTLGEQLFQLLGYTTEDRWQTYNRTIRESLVSFERLRARRYLDVESAKIGIVEINRAMTLEEFSRRYPSSIDLEQLAIINGVETTTRLKPGALVKRVTGGELPEGDNP